MCELLSKDNKAIYTNNCRYRCLTFLSKYYFLLILLLAGKIDPYIDFSTEWQYLVCLTCELGFYLINEKCLEYCDSSCKRCEFNGKEF